MNQNHLGEVFFSKKCVENMEGHVRGDCERERAGFLVGKIFLIDGKLCTYASDAIAAEGAEATFASVEVTPDAQLPVLNHLDACRISNKNLIIVGWFHSHPFGSESSIFLSGFDVEIMRSRFNRPYHIAVVLDPISDCRGVFCMNSEEVRRIENAFVLKEKFELWD